MHHGTTVNPSSGIIAKVTELHLELKYHRRLKGKHLSRVDISRTSQGQKRQGPRLTIGTIAGQGALLRPDSSPTLSFLITLTAIMLHVSSHALSAGGEITTR